jgi:predicted NBD/HSP70 family sugar kinase
MSNGTSVDYVLAIDLGGTHVRAAIIDEEGAIRSTVKSVL